MAGVSVREFSINFRRARPCSISCSLQLPTHHFFTQPVSWRWREYHANIIIIIITHNTHVCFAAEGCFGFLAIALCCCCVCVLVHGGVWCVPSEWGENLCEPVCAWRRCVSPPLFFFLFWGLFACVAFAFFFLLDCVFMKRVDVSVCVCVWASVKCRCVLCGVAALKRYQIY